MSHFLKVMIVVWTILATIWLMNDISLSWSSKTTTTTTRYNTPD